jgi:hypothetical protein
VRIRNVVQELEAMLEPTPAGLALQARARGKAEWKVYKDGTRQGKVSLSGLNLADGTLLELAVDGRRITQLVVQRGAARYRRESERGEGVPVVEENQMLQVFINSGQVILEGRFVPE